MVRWYQSLGATAEIAKVPKGEKDITLVEAVELYLIKRSKKARLSNKANPRQTVENPQAAKSRRPTLTAGRNRS